MSGPRHGVGGRLESKDEKGSRPSRPWQPSPLVSASLALHGVALGALALRPRAWRRVLPWLLADHLLLTAAGAFPRSSWLGPSRTHFELGQGEPGREIDPGEVVLTFDDGPDPEVTPRLAELLRSRGARASFFCIGQRVEAHPEIVRELVADGHRVENHTHRHSHRFSITLYPELLREIGRAQSVITEVTGRAPAWFRAPAGMRNPFVEPVLARLGLHLVAWTRRGYDTVDPRPSKVLSRLVRGLAPGDVLLLHDGNGARGSGVHGSDGPAVLETTRRLLDVLDRRGLRAVALPADGPRPGIEGERGIV